MFRPFKQPSSGNSKELNLEDTQLKYIYYWRDLVLAVLYIYIYIYIYIYLV